jgi:enoyl-CoA hydratase/carnithine racemase
MQIMTTNTNAITVTLTDHVATLILERPPHNFVDADVIRELADQLEALDNNADCRAVVLAANGKVFCAGADLSSGNGAAASAVAASLYTHAMRLFRTTKPIVAAVHGPAIGAGLGLALVADFRVTCEAARYSASFARLGFHPGFGLTTTLPNLIGIQKASLLFYTGQRIDGAQAYAMGVADELVPEAEVRTRAIALAREIATSAPQAILSTRSELRRDLAEKITAGNLREQKFQEAQFATADFKEGIAAAAERRTPVFTGR